MSLNKRILNELHNLVPKKMKNYNLSNNYKFIELGNDIIPKNIGIINLLTKKLEIKIYIKDFYPFNPPLIYILDDKSQNSYLEYSAWTKQIISKKNLSDENILTAWFFTNIYKPQFFSFWKSKIPNSYTCLCCNSFSCKENWIPQNNLIDILCEYLIFKTFDKFSSSLLLKQIYSIFNNNNWILPNEIIFKILDFVIESSQTKNNDINKNFYVTKCRLANL